MVRLLPVYSSTQVQTAIAEVAEKINHEGFVAPAVIIAVLNGGIYFFDRIVKRIEHKFVTDSIRAKSYTGTKSSGNITVLKDLDSDIEGKDCLVVDDILDSGATSFYLNRLLAKRNPARIRYAYLVVREMAAKYDVRVDFKALSIKGDKFIVGCGMDYNEKYRELDGIYEIKRFPD